MALLHRVLTAPLLLALLLIPAPARAQKAPAEFLRTNPKFLQAFRDVAAGPSESTVRVRCDGKDTALGVVVAADGWVLTKAYDLKGKITCRFKRGQEYDAQLVGVHPLHDLALLRVDVNGLTPVEFADSKATKAGSWVASVGLDADPVAVGVVSVPTRAVVTKGPPILDPAKAPYLGVGLDATEDGVKVVQVMPNSAAAKAGLKADDVILSVAGVKVSEPEEFVQQVGKRKVGETVTLKVRRGDEELDVEATLQSRPVAGSPRAELQNRMGSELSTRRTGYPTILQHDSVVKPTDCGGPLVDLKGRVLGINISRAGRVESWAIPSEVITALLPDLKAGKFPPPAEERVEKAERPPEQTLDTLLKAVRARLVLMPDVARAKWNTQRLTRDTAREAQVLDRLAAAGKEKGLAADEVREFFAAQIDAAWLVQEALFAGWKKTEQPKFDDPPDLRRALRPQIDAASAELLTAYAAARPHLSDAALRQHLRDRARTLVVGDGISRAVRDRALQPLVNR